MEVKQLAKYLIISITTALALIAVLFLLISENKPKIGLATPIVTAEPTAEPTAEAEVVLLTPAPTPITIQTEVELPKDAVDIVVNGAVILAVENPETAQQVINDYLASYAEVGDNRRLVRAYTEQTVELYPASGSKEILSYGAALSSLLSNPALLSVTQVLTVCEQTETEIEVLTETNAQLPLGTTFIATAGTSERYIVYYESIFKSGVECSLVETNRFRVGEATRRVVMTGTYTSENEEPEEDEGTEGIAVQTLNFRCPIDGKISSYFGMRNGVMHNGVDFEANAGAYIVAPEGGVVIFCGERGDYGFVIDILHDEGNIVTRLAHLTNVRVELYQRVSRSEPLGELADTGTGEKPHLHVEVLIDGIPYNPLQYIPER
ncbi:MAG: M23 family metallopeptidase [Clostridia bacterium]|nr:M23 family metallopeptidase [Clostridia bacterium]